MEKEEKVKKEEKEEKVEKEENAKKETKNEKNNDFKAIMKKVWNAFFWCFFAIVLIVWIVDYTNTKSGRDPKFCLVKDTIKTAKGDIDSCLGLGYKIYHYHTTDLKDTSEFGPFWFDYRR